MCHSATPTDRSGEETRCSDQCPILLRTFSHILRIAAPCLLLVGAILLVFDFFNNRSEGRSFADNTKTLEKLTIFDYGILAIIVGGLLLISMIIARIVANYMTLEETTVIEVLWNFIFNPESGHGAHDITETVTTRPDIYEKMPPTDLSSSLTYPEGPKKKE